MSSMTVYRQYTAEQLAVQYSPSSCVPDLRVELDAYAAASARTRAALEWRTLSYGPRPEERLDFFPAPAPAGPGGPGAPLVVFLHGGYWQELGRADASFPAAGLNSRGVAYAALGYGLAPRYGLDAIVAMVRKGARWLLAHAGELGCDPARMVLAGSSAGAHLAAMCLLDETPAAAPGQSAGWAGAVLLSGVYDLEPVRLTYVNDRVGMTRDEARRNSPSTTCRERCPRWCWHAENTRRTNSPVSSRTSPGRPAAAPAGWSRWWPPAGTTSTCASTSRTLPRRWVARSARSPTPSAPGHTSTRKPHDHGWRARPHRGSRPRTRQPLRATTSPPVGQLLGLD